MQGTIKTLSQRGHDPVEYDTEAGVVEEAERVLRAAAQNGAALFSGETRERIDVPKEGTVNREGESQGEAHRRAMEENEEIIVLPPMAGG